MLRFCRAALAVLVAMLLVPLAAPHAAEPDVVTVFAAASLTDALQAVAKERAQPGAAEVRFSFAASSTLARQIEAGAPADIFISANPQWMNYLGNAGLIAAETRIEPLGNTLALVAPADSPLHSVTIDGQLDFTALIGDGERIATGDPAHVPVGIYARQALEHFGAWGKTEPLLARSDTVRAALALVERGEAPLGIVYASDIGAGSRVKIVGTFPQDSHPPITYPFAIVAGRDTPAVRHVFERITGGSAARVYERFGFLWRSPTG